MDDLVDTFYRIRRLKCDGIPGAAVKVRRWGNSAGLSREKIRRLGSIWL